MPCQAILGTGTLVDGLACTPTSPPPSASTSPPARSTASPRSTPRLTAAHRRHHRPDRQAGHHPRHHDLQLPRARDVRPIGRLPDRGRSTRTWTAARPCCPITTPRTPPSPIAARTTPAPPKHRPQGRLHARHQDGRGGHHRHRRSLRRPTPAIPAFMRSPWPTAQTTVTSGNIAQFSTAPFITPKLSNLLATISELKFTTSGTYTPIPACSTPPSGSAAAVVEAAAATARPIPAAAEERAGAMPRDLGAATIGALNPRP